MCVCDVLSYRRQHTFSCINILSSYQHDIDLIFIIAKLSHTTGCCELERKYSAVKRMVHFIACGTYLVLSNQSTSFINFYIIGLSYAIAIHPHPTFFLCLYSQYAALNQFGEIARPTTKVRECRMRKYRLL